MTTTTITTTTTTTTKTTTTKTTTTKTTTTKTTTTKTTTTKTTTITITTTLPTRPPASAGGSGSGCGDCKVLLARVSDDRSRVRVQFAAWGSAVVPPTTAIDSGAVFQEQNNVCYGWQASNAGNLRKTALGATFIMPDRDGLAPVPARWCVTVEPGRRYNVKLGLRGHVDKAQFPTRGTEARGSINGQPFDAGPIENGKTKVYEKLVSVTKSDSHDAIRIEGSFPELSAIEFVEVNIVPVVTPLTSDDGADDDDTAAIAGRLEVGQCLRCSGKADDRFLADMAIKQCVPPKLKQQVCGGGQFYNATKDVCQGCPAGTYAESTAFRMRCLPCPDGYMSPAGADRAKACIPNYETLPSTMTTKYCTGKSGAGDESGVDLRGRGIVSITDKEDCRTATAALNWPLTVAQFADDPVCKDELNDCATKLESGNAVWSCGSVEKIEWTALKARGDFSANSFRDVCKVTCDACDVYGKEAESPIFCVLEMDTPTELVPTVVKGKPTSYECVKDGTCKVRFYSMEDQVHFQGANYQPLCKMFHCPTGYVIQDQATVNAGVENKPTCEFSKELVNKYEEENAARYKNFYIVAAIISVILVVIMLGQACCNIDAQGDELNYQLGATMMTVIVVIRSFDFMSDWGFFAISIGNPFFQQELVKAGFDYETFKNFSGLFCVLSTFLWIPDIDGFRQRLHAMSQSPAMRPAESAKYITVLVLLLEDLPQLVLNCIYIDVMSRDSAPDAISVFSVMMTVFGITFNILMICCGSIFWGSDDKEMMDDDGLHVRFLNCLTGNGCTVPDNSSRGKRSLNGHVNPEYAPNFNYRVGVDNGGYV